MWAPSAKKCETKMWTTWRRTKNNSYVEGTEESCKRAGNGAEVNENYEKE
jgi:hypothetical protein